jgi:3-deoxy-D-manno-octulosonate 8-phosphate phosphatase (KDO 8-P phosphatase)
MTARTRKKMQKIRVFAFDVDGVLTDGKINMDEDGREFKSFDVYDGFGVAVLKMVGYKTAIITAKGSPCVMARAQNLGITKVFLNAYPKITAYEQLLKEWKISDDEVCFIGDDIPDICVLKRVGFAVAVNNAAPEVKKAADYVTKRSGGNGAVREVIEMILKAQGKWAPILKGHGA